MRNFETDQMVTIGAVLEALEHFSLGNTHEVDLGDFSYETVSCDSYIEPTKLVNKILEVHNGLATSY